MEGLGLPEKGVTTMRNLAMDVRSLCSDTLFQRASKGTKYKEHPRLDADTPPHPPSRHQSPPREGGLEGAE